jgi:hypothetical protein
VRSGIAALQAHVAVTVCSFERRGHFVLDLFRTEVLGFQPKTLGAAMDRSETTADGDRDWKNAEAQSDPGPPEQRPQPMLSRGERWLACATAAAVLVSGVNALVQVWKVLIEYIVRHG